MLALQCLAQATRLAAPMAIPSSRLWSRDHQAAIRLLNAAVTQQWQFAARPTLGTLRGGAPTPGNVARDLAILLLASPPETVALAGELGFFQGPEISWTELARFHQRAVYQDATADPGHEFPLVALGPPSWAQVLDAVETIMLLARTPRHELRPALLTWPAQYHPLWAQASRLLFNFWRR